MVGLLRIFARYSPVITVSFYSAGCLEMLIWIGHSSKENHRPRRWFSFTLCQKPRPIGRRQGGCSPETGRALGLADFNPGQLLIELNDRAVIALPLSVHF